MRCRRRCIMRSFSVHAVKGFFASLLIALCLFIGISSAYAVIANVQHAVSPDNGSATGTSLALSFGAAVTSGDHVIGSLTYSQTGGTDNLTSITDDKGNTYTVVSKILDAGNSQYFLLFYRENITNAPTTITANFSPTTAWRRMTLSEFSGLQSSSSTDGSTTKTTTGNTGTDAQSSGNITTTANGDLIYGAFVDANGTGDPWSAGTGFTGLDISSSANLPMGHEWRVQSSSGSIAGTFTQGASSASDVGVIAFKAAGGAAPTLRLRSIMGVGQ